MTTRLSSSSLLQVISIAYLPGTCKEDDEFDQTVGVIQEVLLDSKFEFLQKKFCNENCMHFEATEENKLVYMDIFKNYTATIEAFINQVSFPHSSSRDSQKRYQASRWTSLSTKWLSARMKLTNK